MVNSFVHRADWKIVGKTPQGPDIINMLLKSVEYYTTCLKQKYVVFISAVLSEC